MNNCFSIYHSSWIASGPKSKFSCDNIPTKAILLLFCCSEVNSTWLITSELANQRARKALFTCVLLSYGCTGEVAKHERSVRHWTIPENIHTQPRRLPCLNPPLPSKIPKCITPPCPQNSIIMNPPSPSEFLGFFSKYIFDLATALWTNEHEFMAPQGCNLAVPYDKLYSSCSDKKNLSPGSGQAVQTPVWVWIWL